MGRKKKKPIKLWTLDTETRGMFGEVFRVGLYSDGVYYSADTFRDIVTAIEDYDFTENHVYIHNLDFDIAKIFPDLKESIIFDKSLFINGRAVTVHFDSMVLHDSLSLLPGSLDSLCKDFGLTTTAKMDLTEYIKEKGYALYDETGKFLDKESKGNFFENVPSDDPVLNEYLKLDCISLYDIISILSEISELPLEKIIYCPTTASLAMTVFKTNYPQEYKDATKYKFKGEFGEYIEGFIRKGYCGGRTEVFRPYMQNGFHYDINSLYPYVMENYDRFPFGFPSLYKDDKAEQIYRVWKRSEGGAGFIRCTVEVPEMFIPPLPKKAATGKLLFPVGEFESVFAFPEIAFAESLGVKIKEVKEVVFFKETGAIFRNFVRKYKTLKMESTGAKRYFAKLLQNSLYGKFGMKRQRTTFTDLINRQKAEDSGRPYRVLRYTRNFSDIEFIEYQTVSKAMYIQPQIAAYVTALARLELLKGLLEQEAKGQVYYCDTDSIAGTATMRDDMVDGKEYGKWKLEEVIEEGIFLQPKLYAEKTAEGVNIKAKGVPKEIMRNFTFDTYREWANRIETKDTARLNIFDGLEARQKFLTSLKNNDSVEHKRILNKSINILAAQKRELDFKNNTSRPLTTEEFIHISMEDAIENYHLLAEAVTESTGDFILDMVKTYGKPVPDPEDPDYKKIPAAKKRKYFKKDGIPLTDFLSRIGWSKEEFYYEIICG